MRPWSGVVAPEVDGGAGDRARHIRAAREQLEAGRRRRKVPGFAPLPVVTMDQAGIIRAINPAAVVLLGAEERSRPGWALSLAVARAHRPLLRSHLTRCRQSRGETIVTQLTMVTSCGDLRPVQLVSRPAAEDGVAYTTTIVDLSDRAQLEREKGVHRACQESARQASEAKDRFIAVLSHELRGPMSALLGAATALEGSAAAADPAELRRLASVIRRNVSMQSRLIDDLLELTRLKRGVIRLELQPTDLHELVQEAVETFANELGAKALTVVMKLGASRHVVSGDPGRLRQVLLNLVKNAIKFTPPGGRIAVRSWNERERLMVEVSDSGIGIEPSVIDRLFAPYEQVCRGAGGGVGLGLAIAKGIVDLHRGRIAASSPGLGKGARFVVELDALAMVKADPPSVSDPITTEEPPAPTKQGCRILVVDDNHDFAQSLALALRWHGYDVLTVSTVRAALEVDPTSVDLVLSDIELPDGGGLELMRALRRRTAVRAIALSGYGQSRDVAASKKAGFAAHLSKPVELGALLDAIRAATEPGRGRGRSKSASTPTPARKRFAREGEF